MDLDPYSDPLTEEFWETVCHPAIAHLSLAVVNRCEPSRKFHTESRFCFHICVSQLFNCTLDYSKALKRSKQRATEGNSTLSDVARGFPDGLCTGREPLAKLNSTYSDVSQLRITYRSVSATTVSTKWLMLLC